MNVTCKKFFVTGLLLIVGLSQDLFACAACYGASDSPLAKGMNWGIMALLVFIFSVLVAVTGFFIYIVRRANRLAASATPVATESKS